MKFNNNIYKQIWSIDIYQIHCRTVTSWESSFYYVDTMPNIINMHVPNKHKYHKNKTLIVHELRAVDTDKKMNVCATTMYRWIGNNYLNNILFKDETTFCLNDIINKPNCRYWVPDNPHWILELHKNRISRRA